MVLVSSMLLHHLSNPCIVNIVHTYTYLASLSQSNVFFLSGSVHIAHRTEHYSNLHIVCFLCLCLCVCLCVFVCWCA